MPEVRDFCYNWNLAGQNFMRALACGSFALFVCVACESLRAFSRQRNAKAFYIIILLYDLSEKCSD